MMKSFNSLKINNLLVFNKIVEMGSISLAAKALGRSQGQLSQILNAIEDVCGCELVIRGGGALTPEGLLFKQAVTVYLSAYRDFVDSIRKPVKGYLSPVVICAPPGVVHYISWKILPIIAQKHPAISIVLKTIGPGDLECYDHVLDDSHILISYVPSHRMSSVNQCVSLDVGFYASPSLNLPTFIKGPQDLINAGDSCIVVENYGSNSNSWAYTDESNSIVELDVKSRFRCHDVLSAVSMATSGLGIIHVPSVFVDDYVRRGELIPLFNEYIVKKKIYLIYKKERYVNRTVSDVYSDVLNYARSLGVHPVVM